MSERSIQRVLAHSGELQRAGTLDELIRVANSAVRDVSRFRTAWLAWLDPENDAHVRILAVQGSVPASWMTALVIPLEGDAMIQEILRGGKPVVVEDARTDPRTNKDIVAQTGNRTIINIPVTVGGNVRGSLGVGSFFDEGVMAPTTEELEALTLFATQLAPAFDRIRALEERDRVIEERQALEQHLRSLERVELMGVLAAGVAHDMNNLLSVAMLSLDSIPREPLPELHRESLGDAARALSKMREISRQLLQLGRREAPTRAELDLNARVERTLELVRPSIPRGVKLVHEHDGLPRVEADSVQLEQALANLVLNARDAVGERGTITLRVDERQFDPALVSRVRGSRPGRFAHVRVTDTGPGLPPELKDRVFDPLFTTKATGTGLGLAVVSRITAQHQGFVAVESEPGHGTSFDLYLPAL